MSGPELDFEVGKGGRMRAAAVSRRISVRFLGGEVDGPVAEEEVGV